MIDSSYLKWAQRHTQLSAWHVLLFKNQNSKQIDLHYYYLRETFSCFQVYPFTGVSKNCPNPNFTYWFLRNVHVKRISTHSGPAAAAAASCAAPPRRLSSLAIACKPLVSSPVLSFYLLRRLNVVFRWDVGTEQKQGRKATHSGTCFFNYILYNNSILEFLEDFYACPVTRHIANTVKSRV